MLHERINIIIYSWNISWKNINIIIYTWNVLWKNINIIIYSWNIILIFYHETFHE